MKKYKITGVGYSNDSKITVFVDGGKTFKIQKPTDGIVIPGDEICVMYDNMFGSMPIAYIYKGIIDMGEFAPCESMGGKCYVSKLKMLDKPLFNFIAMKNIIADGKRPRLAMWRNAQILAGINLENWKQSKGR